MLRAVETASILGLLAVFFAYLLAPAIDALRRRIRVGRRRRPLSRVTAILLLYAILFAPVAAVWRRATDPVREWVDVTAPQAISRVFVAENRVSAVDRITRILPTFLFPRNGKPEVSHALMAFFGYVEDHLREALSDLVAASAYVRWLAVAPVVSFLLLAYAPAFRRSALRALPHGHLSWRGDEYLRDVNSALAGYIRAQLAAGAISGIVCAAAFWLFGLQSAFSLGVVAGVLELVPVIGPLTVMVMAAGQAESHPLAIVAFLIAFRGLQDYGVYPHLIRRRMHLPSIVVIVAVWCGAVLNGAAGVLFAIPAAGFLSVSLRHWREYRDIERLVRTAGRPPKSDSGSTSNSSTA